MFLGHFAVGFAAKRAAPESSLGPLFAAPPTTRALTIVGLCAWLLPLWACWADRHRSVLKRSVASTLSH